MIVAVVLAAGRSERFGRPKALLPCGETTFLGAISDKLAASRVDDVRIVVGHDAGAIMDESDLPDEEFLVNADYGSGMLSSILCGIRGMPRETEAFLVWPVDHPLVRVDTVDRLVGERARARAPVVLPEYRERRGHPVLFSVELVSELREAPPTEGARAVVHAHAADRAVVEVDDPGIVADIDTPEAYLEAFGRPHDRED